MLTERLIQAQLWRENHAVCHRIMPNFTMPKWWECDLLLLRKTMLTHEFEIKLSTADYRKDFIKMDKHDVLNKHAQLQSSANTYKPNRFSFVIPAALRARLVVPDYAGIVLAEWRNGRVVLETERNAPLLHSVRCSAKLASSMERAAYYRFWNTREDQAREARRDRQRLLDSLTRAGKV